MDILGTQNGQTELDSLATPWQIQRELNDLIRRLSDTDTAFLRLCAERTALLDAYAATALRHQDALYAGTLQQQGAAEVVAACEAWGIVE